MKILIAIGCDNYSYDNVQNLFAAENDAKAIFDALVNCEDSIYDEAASFLLLSPTSEEIKAAIEEATFRPEPVEISIFYAGHGAVKNGSYFLLARNSHPNRLTVSSVGMTDVFRWLNEANVIDSNIVIDSCHAGGLAHDLPAFLSPSEIGASGMPSLSILASVTADQEAREIDGHGLATKAILSCISGEVPISSSDPILSLSDIGYAVSRIMGHDGLQTPVQWGLSLFGKTSFCKNPKQGTHKAAIGELPGTLNISKSEADLLSKHSNDLWRLYLDSHKDFDSIAFLRFTESVLADIPGESASKSAVVTGLMNTFFPLLEESEDPFESVELLAACATSLLPYLEESCCPETIERIAVMMLSSIDKAVMKLNDAIKDDEYCLLSDRFGLADLYYLPIRLLKIFGWIGARKFISDSIDPTPAQDVETHKSLVRSILDSYTCSFVAVSEEQSSSALVFFWAAENLGVKEEAEQVFGLLCSSFLHYEAKISAPNLQGEDAYKFTKSRSSSDKASCEDLIVTPTEFLSAILIASCNLELDDVVDEFIEGLDRKSGNIFIPDSYKDFSRDYIQDGVNFTYTIGSDIWKSSDFEVVWRAATSKIEIDPVATSSAARIAAVCSSLIQPDRAPWLMWWSP